MTRLIQNQKHLANWVRGHEGTIDIAVAFWGDGAVKALGLDQRKTKFRVLLDLSAGASNPKEVKVLKSLPNATVKSVYRLHAKAYITEHEALIGSANNSTNGLGLEGSEASRWHELGVLTEDKKTVDQAKSWFNALWRGAPLVSDQMLEQTTAEWKLRQKSRPLPKVSEKNYLQAALKHPAEMRDRNIYVVVTTMDTDSIADKEVEDLKELKGQEPLYWQYWPEIPRDARLICFTNYLGDGFEIESPPIVYAPPEPDICGTLSLVSRVDSAPFTVGQLKTWLPALKRAKKSLTGKHWNTNVMCWELVEFAEKFGKP